ncbi:hypothetical protein JOL62DRAFT_417233 [Phyllosticta paracitricarpa]|uniref:Transmembrane protein n=1 Tax=Phyllosticta paracitricarpa TaxID=2016321 RepID=A0ABR1MTZ8_9PEZI
MLADIFPVQPFFAFSLFGQLSPACNKQRTQRHTPTRDRLQTTMTKSFHKKPVACASTHLTHAPRTTGWFWFGTIPPFLGPRSKGRSTFSFGSCMATAFVDSRRLAFLHFPFQLLDLLFIIIIPLRGLILAFSSPFCLFVLDGEDGMDESD